MFFVVGRGKIRDSNAMLECIVGPQKFDLFPHSSARRLAARFNAIVVPFGSIGSADNVHH